MAAASAIIFGALIVLSISVYDTLNTSYTGLSRAEDERNSLLFQRLNTHIEITHVTAAHSSVTILANNTGGTVIHVSDNGKLLLEVIINGTLATEHISSYRVNDKTTSLWGPGEELTLRLYGVRAGDNTSIVLVSPGGEMAEFRLHVYSPPDAHFIISGESAPYRINEDRRYTFDASPSTSGAEITEYLWDFDDGSSAYGRQVRHIFTQPGTYHPVLTIKDSLGRADTFSLSVVVRDTTPPFANIIAPAEADEDTVVNFGCTAQDNVGISNYLWDFGDGGSAFTQNPSHTFERPGFYSVSLTVRDYSNLLYTASATILVRDITPPIADAGGNQTAHVNETVYFNASASYDPENGNIVSYVWDFGDGSHDSGVYAQHSYSSPGNYTATLTVKDIAGNTAQDSVNVEVKP